MSQPKPQPLSEDYRHNFGILLHAAENGDLCLVSAIRKADRANVALVCAMVTNEDGTYSPIPLAVMCEGNPFEDFEDPTV